MSQKIPTKLKASSRTFHTNQKEMSDIALLILLVMSPASTLDVEATFDTDKDSFNEDCMAIQGKFIIIHGATYSPLIIYGVGTFQAFSGNGFYRNKGGCSNIRGNGPLPPGRYYIVDRPTGSWISSKKTSLKDSLRRLRFENVDHTEWFGLYRLDGSVDDYTFVENVARGNFRLHPGTISEGCITLSSHIDFQTLRRLILQQEPKYLFNSKLKIYGTIEVVVNDGSCT